MFFQKKKKKKKLFVLFYLVSPLIATSTIICINKHINIVGHLSHKNKTPKFYIYSFGYESDTTLLPKTQYTDIFLKNILFGSELDISIHTIGNWKRVILFPNVAYRKHHTTLISLLVK